jgi:shikimate dehydrogenase
MDLAASLYDAAFEAAGIAIRCETRRTPATELANLISQIRGDARLAGVAVMMPNTVPIIGLLDGLGPEAQTIKAVNTVSHRAGALIGWNTDRPAFVEALEEADIQPKGRSVLMLGAGGAARACVDGLRESAGKVWVTSPDLDEARALCRDLQVSAGGPTPLGSLSLIVKKVDLVINATPVGSDGQGVPFPVEWISPSQFVFDLVCQPPVTPLLRAARERGARAVNGLGMLLFNGLAAFPIWTGEPASEAAMRAALEKAVLNRLSS